MRRAPVLGPVAKVLAGVAIVPIMGLGSGVILVEAWLALHHRPNELLGALGGLAVWLGVYTLPILGALWLGSSRLGSVAKALSNRRRGRPHLPRSIHPARFVPDLEPTPLALPLFQRPLAHLWSTVAEVDVDGIELKVFELVHADLLGEKGRAPRGTVGLPVLSCAAVRVGGDLPLVVVRPARSKPFSLPDGMQRRTTELGRFNDAFHLYSVDPFEASALVDARTIGAILQFDPRFSVEIGGEWVIVHAPRLRVSEMQRLIDDAAALARVFPRIASSLYPGTPGAIDGSVRA